jgi:hypothetical protein
MSDFDLDQILKYYSFAMQNPKTASMNKQSLLLPLMLTVFTLNGIGQCSPVPPAGTFILSSFTVGSTYTLNGSTTYPTQRAFYICQGEIITLQNRPGNDTFYVATGGKLIGSEPNVFRVILDGGATYDANNSGTATIYYETTSTISNFSGPMLPPCPSVTISMSLIGSGACGPTSVDMINGVANLVSVFPNPATDRLNISIHNFYGNTSVKIYDMLGKEMKDFNSVSGELNVDISSWPVGLYNVVVNENGHLQSVKVMKE